MMLLISTYVAQSPIEGLGVYAGEPIKRGQLIWALNPKFDIFLSASEIEALPPHMQEFVARYSYPHLEMPGIVIVDADHGKFMNHNLNPNTDFRVFDQGYALVDIAVGDEITCNYHEFDPRFAGFFTGAEAPAAEAMLHSNGR